MRIGVIWIAAAVFALQASLGRAETLADALALAYKNSNILEQQQALLRASNEDVATAMASLRPVVSFLNTISYRHTNLNPAGQGSTLTTDSGQNFLEILIQTPIYTWGRNKLGVEIAQQTVLATEQELRGYEQQVLLDAANAYVDVKLQEQTVDLQQSAVKLSGEDLRSVQDRFAVGEVSTTDVSQAEAQLAASEAQLAAAIGNLAVARETYKSAVGVYPGKLAPLPLVARLPRTLGEAQAIAAKSHPDILRVQYLVLAADRTVDLQKANFFPTIDGGASYAQDVSGQGDLYGFVEDGGLDARSDAQLFIQFNQTLYSGGRLSAAYRQSLDNQAYMRALLQETAVTTARSVAIDWAQVEAARATISANEKQVSAAQDAYDGQKLEAEVGSASTIDVLIALQVLLSAKADLLASQARLFNGQYALMASIGLVSAGYLNLDVPVYDVKAYYDAVKDAPATSFQGKQLDKIMKLVGQD